MYFYNYTFLFPSTVNFMFAIFSGPLPPPTMTYGVGDYADTSRGKEEPELNSSDKLPGKVEAEDVHEVVDPAGPAHRVQPTPLVYYHRLGYVLVQIL
jgi:hypothetical protein